MSTRIGWIDTAKGFAIVLMVFGHVWTGLYKAGLMPDGPLYESVYRGIYLFHMPFFFFASGIFFLRSIETRPFSATLRKVLLTLAYPLLLWAYINAVFKLVAGELANNSITLTETLLYPFPPKDLFWFLLALICIQLAVAAAMKLPKALRSPAIGLLVLASVVHAASGYEIPVFNSTVEHIPFFVAGMLVPRLAAFWSPRLETALLALAAFVGAELIALLSPDRLYPLADMLVGMVAVLAFVQIMQWLANRLPANPLIDHLTQLGRATMPVYLAHVIILAAIRIGLSELGIDNLPLHLLAGTIASIYLPLLMFAITTRLGWNRALGLGPDTRPAAGPTRSVPPTGAPLRS